MVGYSKVAHRTKEKVRMMSIRSKSNGTQEQKSRATNVKTIVNVNKINYAGEAYRQIRMPCHEFLDDYLAYKQTFVFLNLTNESNAAALRMYEYVRKWLRILSTEACNRKELDPCLVDDLADVTTCYIMLREVLGDNPGKAPSDEEWAKMIKKAKCWWWATPNWPAEWK